MTALFVTAIGTDCGKTHVAAALLRHLVAQKRQIAAVKPLMTGYDPANLAPTDAGRLLAAMGREPTPEAIDAMVWRRFPDWTAPNVAARKAGVPLAYDDLLAFVRARMPSGAVTLVEGAGGVMSPLTDTHTNIDLARDLAAPVLLMASNYLGAVSHTLSALECLVRRALHVKAVCVTQPLPNAGPAAPLVDELQRWTATPVLPFGFSPDAEAARPFAAALAEKLFE